MRISQPWALYSSGNPLLLKQRFEGRASQIGNHRETSNSSSNVRQSLDFTSDVAPSRVILEQFEFALAIFAHDMIFQCVACSSRRTNRCIRGISGLVGI